MDTYPSVSASTCTSLSTCVQSFWGLFVKILNKWLGFLMLVWVSPLMNPLGSSSPQITWCCLPESNELTGRVCNVRGINLFPGVCSPTSKGPESSCPHEDLSSTAALGQPLLRHQASSLLLLAESGLYWPHNWSWHTPVFSRIEKVILLKSFENNCIYLVKSFQMYMTSEGGNIAVIRR